MRLGSIGAGVSGLGFTVSGSSPYFTPDPEQYISGTTNGMPNQAMTIDSSMQQYLSSDVKRISNGQPPNGGTTPSGIQADYRRAAENYCNTSYGTIGCAGQNADAVADKYSALFLQIAKTVPAPQYAQAYGSMYDFLFNGGYALAQSGATAQTGQLPSPVPTPVVTPAQSSAPAQNSTNWTATPFGTSAVVSTTPTSISQVATSGQSSTPAASATDSGLSTTTILLIAGAAALFLFSRK